MNGSIKEKAIKKILEEMFKTPQRVTIPETEIIVWTQTNLIQGKTTNPGKWILIAYKLPEETKT